MTRAVISYGPVAVQDTGNYVDMTAELGGVWLPNPVLTASGCAASGRELDQFFDVTKIGAVVTKSIMLLPRSGRPTPRMAETPSMASSSTTSPGCATVASERWCPSPALAPTST
jgi:dihydroorotate dehydrogenase